MQDNPRLLRAVPRTRAEHCFVLMIDGRYAVGLQQSLGQRDSRDAIRECARRAIEAEAQELWNRQQG